jgi:hypothetical protein
MQEKNRLGDHAGDHGLESADNKQLTATIARRISLAAKRGGVVSPQLRGDAWVMVAHMISLFSPDANGVNADSPPPVTARMQSMRSESRARSPDHLSRSRLRSRSRSRSRSRTRQAMRRSQRSLSPAAAAAEDADYPSSPKPPSPPSPPV